MPILLLCLLHLDAYSLIMLASLFCTYIQTIILLCMASLLCIYIYIYIYIYAHIIFLYMCTYIYTISCSLENAKVFSLCSQYIIMFVLCVCIYIYIYIHNIFLYSLIMLASLFCTFIPTIILSCLASLCVYI
jgi:hypothetical protein